jgi:hypothetical protein
MTHLILYPTMVNDQILYQPVDDLGKKFAKLLSTSLLTSEQLRGIRSLGYTFEFSHASLWTQAAKDFDQRSRSLSSYFFPPLADN